MSDLYMDWEDFDIHRGSRVSFKKGDEILTGTVKHVWEDKDTGEIKLEME